MKVGVVLLSILAAVVLAVAAGTTFYFVQKPVYEVQATEGVRVGDPGHNLVGPDWSGDVGGSRDSIGSNRGPTGANQ